MNPGKSKQGPERESVWDYLKPAPGFEPIQGYVTFYASLMDACCVDGEKAGSRRATSMGAGSRTTSWGPSRAPREYGVGDAQGKQKARRRSVLCFEHAICQCLRAPFIMYIAAIRRKGWSMGQAQNGHKAQLTFEIHSCTVGEHFMSRSLRITSVQSSSFIPFVIRMH